jgi:uncharacterized membrane protein
MDVIPLPNELTNLILEFSGYHKLRNGQYMKQIAEVMLFEMYIKIQRMPKIKYGYVQLRMAPTTTTIILFNSNYNYDKSNRL